MAHATDSASERCRHANCQIMVDAVEVGKGCHDRLRAVVALLEVVNGFFYSFFVHVIMSLQFTVYGLLLRGYGLEVMGYGPWGKYYRLWCVGQMSWLAVLQKTTNLYIVSNL